MPVSAASGWGFGSTLQAATQVIGGVESVVPNIGIGRQIIAGGAPIRITKLSFRVDIAPDVPSGTVIGPTAWRLIAFAGALPSDVTDYQRQGFPLGGFPAIPRNISAGAANTVIWDEWLDFAAGDEGLNKLVSRDFTGSGPSVGDNQTMSIVLIPILAALSQAHVGIANVMMTLGVFGEATAQNGANGNSLSGNERSLQRFAVPAMANR